MPVQADPVGLNAQLQQRLHFSAADLAANRGGRLTPRQIENLHRGRGCYRAFGCAFAAFGLPSSLPLLVTAGGLLWYGREWGALVLGGLGLLLLIASLYVLILTQKMQPSSSLAVRQTEGSARVRIDAASDSLWKARVTIGGVTFRMSSYAARLFKGEADFRAYYVQSGWMALLLSVEVVGSS